MSSVVNELKEHLKWSHPFEMDTKKGKKLVSTAKPDKHFWSLWRTNKTDLKASGITVFRKDGEWTAFRWINDNKQTQEQVDAIMDTEASTIIQTINTNKSKTVLVICPVSMRDVWAIRFDKHLTLKRKLTVMDGVTEFPINPQVVIINFDQCRKWMEELRSITWSDVIIEEPHYLKNEESGRTISILGNGEDIPPIKSKRVTKIGREE